MILLNTMLESMYSEAGAEIVPVSKFTTNTDATHKHETRASFFSRTQAKLAKNEVVILRCTREYMSYFADYEDWLSCGAIVVTPMRTFVVEIDDSEAPIESMRVHFSKSSDDLCGCGICDGPDRDITCFRCWNGVCKRCFARTHVNARANPDIWPCPFCRASTDIETITRNIPYETCATGKFALPAIRDSMNALGLDETQLCVSGCIVEGGASSSTGYHDRSLPIKLRAMRNSRGGGGRRRRAKTRVWLETDHSGLVIELLQTPGTVFLVGDIPHMCESVDCDNMHGDPDKGRAYVVSDTGEALEMVDMFGPESARVRAWDV